MMLTSDTWLETGIFLSSQPTHYAVLYIVRRSVNKTETQARWECRVDFLPNEIETIRIQTPLDVTSSSIGFTIQGQPKFKIVQYLADTIQAFLVSQSRFDVKNCFISFTRYPGHNTRINFE